MTPGHVVGCVASSKHVNLPRAPGPEGGAQSQ